MTDAVAEEGDLITRREGSAGIIRLNRPKAINAVTLEMFHDIDKALDAFEKDPAVAVILLEGQGRPRQDPVARRIHPQRPDQEIPKTLCRLHGRHRDGRRRRPVGAFRASRRHRQD
jgi:hypothetical protein